jgi:hypothetical protein
MVEVVVVVVVVMTMHPQIAPRMERTRRRARMERERRVRVEEIVVSLVMTTMMVRVVAAAVVAMMLVKGILFSQPTAVIVSVLRSHVLASASATLIPLMPQILILLSLQQMAKEKVERTRTARADVIDVPEGSKRMMVRKSLIVPTTHMRALVMHLD